MDAFAQGLRRDKRLRYGTENVLRLSLVACPYLGDEEVRVLPDPEFQGVDRLAVRPLIKNAPVIPRPGPVD